jgi:hypothetical protein
VVVVAEKKAKAPTKKRRKIIKPLRFHCKNADELGAKLLRAMGLIMDIMILTIT